MEGTVTYSALGCVYGGTSYTIAASEVGMVLPDSVTYSLSRCAAILYLCEWKEKRTRGQVRERCLRGQI